MAASGEGVVWPDGSSACPSLLLSVWHCNSKSRKSCFIKTHRPLTWRQDFHTFWLPLKSPHAGFRMQNPVKHNFWSLRVLISPAAGPVLPPQFCHWESSPSVVFPWSCFALCCESCLTTRGFGNHPLIASQLRPPAEHPAVVLQFNQPGPSLGRSWGQCRLKLLHATLILETSAKDSAGLEITKAFTEITLIDCEVNYL